MNLTNRDRVSLVLDKSVCCSESEFNYVNDWTDCLNELCHYFVDHYVQTKVHERDEERESDTNEEDETTETDEDAGSEIETETDGRFGCTRTVLDSFITKKKNIPEHVKKQVDGVAARKEHNIATSSWIEHKVKWRKSHSNKELDF